MFFFLVKRFGPAFNDVTKHIIIIMIIIKYHLQNATNLWEKVVLVV